MYFIITSFLINLWYLLVIGGLLGYVVAEILPIYKQPIKIISIVLFTAGIFICGLSTERHDRLLEIEKQKAHIALLEKQAAEKTAEVVIQYVDRVKVIKEKGETIYEQVPVYITQEADSMCTLTDGFVELHNSAVQNRLPKSAEGANDKAAGIKLSDASRTIINNYMICHENAAKLEALQSWVENMQNVYGVK